MNQFVYCYTCQKFLNPYFNLKSVVIAQNNGHQKHKVGLKLK